MGFHLIEAKGYVYRVEYIEDPETEIFSVLWGVRAFCRNPRSPLRCPDGNPPEETSSSSSSTSQPPLLTTLELAKRAVTTSIITTSPHPTPARAAPSPTPTQPEVDIDLGKLDVGTIIDIMLKAVVDIKEVKNAHLELNIETNCFTHGEEQPNCNEVVVEMQGRRIGSVTTVELANRAVTTFIMPTSPRRTPSPASANAAPAPTPTQPEVDIDLGKLDIGTILDIMLKAVVDMKEVKNAHLELGIETNCFTHSDSKQPVCNEVVVEMKGHRIGIITTAAGGPPAAYYTGSAAQVVLGRQ